jgi:hypothetical protein
MLPDHPARLQCHPGQGQEAGVHTLWFPCRFLHGEGHTQAKQEGLSQLEFRFQTG